MADVKPGTETTEYKVAKSTGVWGIVTAICGLVVTTGSAVADALGADTTIGIIVGGIVGIAGVIMKSSSSLGYVKSRTDVKVAAEKATPAP